MSYGSKPKDAPNWRTKMLRENQVDLSRVHFLGKVPYATYKKVLQIAAVHLYLTYPFVLSWSLLEAMASGCLIVASDTAPVREVIRDEKNGFLVDFFKPDEIASRILSGLGNSGGG
ncbi:glycosyltransferase [Pseudomonas sp. zjy_8]